MAQALALALALAFGHAGRVWPRGARLATRGAFGHAVRTTRWEVVRCLARFRQIPVITMKKRGLFTPLNYTRNLRICPYPGCNNSRL
ncbi:hypothetical protein [Moorena sp. SIO4G3]|uniref:hypothetical protein n=1 Tax=Moorena sp. SIO4G3 TaxID=2607821 RepID=UPI00142B1498|nr:hypothetical protein [Moorena sp. SIO4G3]NEO78521.1 hypothetical protein [Moorena sp. SIO4G3]